MAKILRTDPETEAFIKKLNPIATAIGDLDLGYWQTPGWLEPNGDRVFEFTSGTATTLLLTIKNDKE